MGTLSPTAFRAPDVTQDGVEIRTGVQVEPGVSFDIVIGKEADDPVSRSLHDGSYGAFHELYHLMRAIVPPGGRVLDLGTHIGAFALGAAASGREVLAVEASPRNAALVQASIDRNRFGKFRLVHAAVSDHPGTLEFNANGPYGHVATSAERGTVRVPCLRIDDLLAQAGWDRVDFIKIDIEGSEVAALRGMSRLLAGPDAPPIFVESNGHTLNIFGERPDTLKSALEPLGYTNHLVEGDSLRAVRAGDIQPATVVDYLAFKRLPSGLSGRRIAQPIPQAVIAEQIQAAAASPAAVDRLHLVRELARASEWVRSAPGVAEVVDALRSDAEKSVRDAAKSIPAAGAGWMRRSRLLSWFRRAG